MNSQVNSLKWRWLSTFSSRRSSSGDYQYFGSKCMNAPRSPNRATWIGLGTCAGLGGLYYVTHLEKVPISGRTRFMAISPETEKKMANTSYRQFMSMNRGLIVPHNHPASILVREIATKIIQASGITDVNWEVHVINSPTANAVVLPGGKIFVFMGLVRLAEEKDQIAGVLAHEIGHQIAKHSSERLSWVKVLTAAQFVMSVFTDPSLFFNKLILDVGFMYPHSRVCELEADYIGLMLMAKACYDPKATIRMWNLLDRESKRHGTPPEYLSTHPSFESRLEKTKEWLPEAESILEQTDCHHITSFYDIFRDKWSQRRW